MSPIRVATPTDSRGGNAGVSDILATLERLRDEAQRIADERDAAERNLLAVVESMLTTGEITEADASTVYADYRDVALPGHSKRWDATVSLSSARAHRLGVSHGRGQYTNGTWEGAWPVEQDAPAPQHGANVTYRLFGADGDLLYIGSTGLFRARMRQHRRTTEWPSELTATWQAVAWPTRREAYDVEEKMIATEHPRYNVRGTL